ncbi:MAG: hypothetical protein VB104_07845 [Candidatus Limiplasma sp.]|nr:hypothetical protein [Candidatus Limiplasma sp.]
MMGWVKRMLQKYRDRRLLRRMENAVGLRLSAKQRSVILSEEEPDMRDWPRRSGKTICAVLWVFLHWDGHIKPGTMFLWYHDPDVYRYSLDAPRYRYDTPSEARKDWAWKNMLDIYDQLACAGIRPRCTVEGR